MNSGSGGGPPASPQQFCLRWNNYQSNLTNVFDQLLQSESFVDVTLACDGHSVKAHKMVLSACSPYFQSLFFDNPCQHPIVILKDIKWPELKAAVEFMYKGEINVSQEQIGPLLKVAESLKIRGLADVNGEHDLGKGLDDLSLSRNNKRRRISVEPSSPDAEMSEPLEGRALELVTTSPPSTLPPSAPPTPQSTSNSMMPLSLRPPSSRPQPPSSQPTPEDLEIKPGIAEMIREEERAKMLESSHAWLGASTSSLAADSYQYQLQSMWQKCWNTNQSLVHNLRFRERGPLKSWRPETMAEAILSVLKEGLSLSQAARKYDIPYPTFVLYANRVHNMLGPSADGGSDLRPKGRGRPQRILLGIWPEDHIRGVIRAVVFRDPQHMKDENLNIGYHHRLQSPSVPRTPQLNTAPPPSSYLPTSPGYPAPGYHHNKPPMCGQDVVHNYSTSGSGSGGGSGPGSISGNNAVNPGGVSPNSAAAAVVAVAQNLRQQMLAAAAHHHTQQQQQQQQQQPQSQQQQSQSQHQQQQGLHPSHHLHPQMNHGQQHHMNPSMAGNPQILPQGPGFGFLAAAAAAHCANGTNLVLHSPSPDNSSPRSSPLTQPNNNMEMPMQLGFKPLVNDIPTSRSDHLFSDEIEDLVKRPQPSETPGKMKAPNLPYSPNEASDLSMKAEQMFQEEMENIMSRPPVSEAAKVKVGMSVSGMPYKGNADGDYLGSRSESLFQEDIEDLVKSPQQTQSKEPMHRPVDQRTE